MSDKLKKRARRKTLTQAYVAALLTLETPLKKSYRNTFYCNDTIERDGETIKSNYCKNRWCILCAAIRTADLMNKYLTALEKMQDPQFVTLTVRNVPAQNLRAKVLECRDVVRRFYANTKREKHRPVLLRKIECTVRPAGPDGADFHPHIHVVIRGATDAYRLIFFWLNHFGEQCEMVAQDVRPADPDSLREMFKYFTKIVSKGRTIDVEHLDVIFQALRGIHTIRPYNIRPAKTDGPDMAEIETVKGALFDWQRKLYDWVNVETGELLSNYEPSEQVKNWENQFTKQRT